MTLQREVTAAVRNLVTQLVGLAQQSAMVVVQDALACSRTPHADVSPRARRIRTRQELELLSEQVIRTRCTNPVFQVGQD
jgi:hypothetical protein